MYVLVASVRGLDESGGTFQLGLLLDGHGRRVWGCSSVLTVRVSMVAALCLHNRISIVEFHDGNIIGQGSIV